MSAATVDGLIEVTIEGRLGIIALNRPQAINALNPEMVTAISAQLSAWSAVASVRAVLFEGRGDKGFCAGGDVRAVRDAVLAGRAEEGFAFFDAEYAMNEAIATYGKPVIALADGIVMGGGIGIAGHADFRFATDRAKFAMPEAAIGFVSDVGVNAILARAPENRALLFLMTGLTVGPADALALGLTDCIIPAERMADVRRAIVAAAAAGDVETALVEAMQANGIEPGEPALCDHADQLAAELSLPTAAEIVAATAEATATLPTLATIAETLAARSPASLEAIVSSHRAARRLGDLGATLALDRRLARLMADRPDFAEGVRAVLVDKDQTPAWAPLDSGLAGEIEAAVAAITSGRA